MVNAPTFEFAELPAPVLAPTPPPGERVPQRIVLPGQTPQGEPILSVLLKRTYHILPGKQCVRAAQDRKLIPGDLYWGNPMNSSVRYETDFVPFKLGTDVVLDGKAYAPRGVATASFEVSLQVANRLKRVLVIGNRTARFNRKKAPTFTEPEPCTSLDLRYERAYGGTDVFSDKSTIYPYPRNPLGCGFVVANTDPSVDKLTLPNFEDPDARLTPERLCLGEYAKWENQPMPAGLGWFSKTWLPRARFAGVLPGDRATEKELRAAYALLVPAQQRQTYLKNGLPDMDFRFFNGASPGLDLPYLSGAEEIVASNLCPEGLLSFSLPGENPHIGLDIGEGIQTPDIVLHTVMIHMEQRQVDLVWRGASPYPGPDWLPKMRKMELEIV
jgi:hypothetical protein